MGVGGRNPIFSTLPPDLFGVLFIVSCKTGYPPSAWENDESNSFTSHGTKNSLQISYFLLIIVYSASPFFLLVTAPGPVIYGILFDKSCLLFQTSCGITGNCLVYDVVKLRILLFGLSTIFATTSFLLALLTLCLVCFSKRSRVSNIWTEASRDPYP